MGVVDFFVGCFWWVVCCFVFFGMVAVLSLIKCHDVMSVRSRSSNRSFFKRVFHCAEEL